MKNPYIGIQHAVFTAGYRAALKDVGKFIKGVKDTTPDVPETGHIVLRTFCDTITDLVENHLTKEE